MTDRHGVRRGQIAYGSRGNKLGRVLQCDEAGFFIEKGIVFTEDYRVEYEEVASVEGDQVHLRIPASALVPEEKADPWSPARDPSGTASGTDLEPLRAGMAEIDEEQRRERSAAAGSGEGPIPRRGARARRDALAREARSRDARARSGKPRQEQPDGRTAARRRAEDDAELEQHIEEEVEDYERGAGVALRGEHLVDGHPAERGTGATASQPQRSREEPASGMEPPARGGRSTRKVVPERQTAQAAATRPAMPRRLDYRKVAPEAIAAMRTLERYVRGSGLEPSLLELVRLRASQLNGCAYCIDMHTQDARRAGETEQRLYALAVWKETPFFTVRERAALAWTEAVTRLGADRVDDETYRLARDQFGEKELVDLALAIIAINGWNRLAIAFRTEPGSYRPPKR